MRHLSRTYLVDAGTGAPPARKRNLSHACMTIVLMPPLVVLSKSPDQFCCTAAHSSPGKIKRSVVRLAQYRPPASTYT